MIALRPLARFVTAPTRTPSHARCELCTAEIGDVHRHVLELPTGGVLCACRPCAILFASPDGFARYRTVPDRVRIDPSFALPPGRLGIPVGVAFCVRASQDAPFVANFPGPSGIVAAELSPEASNELARATPLAGLVEPAVEALLLHSERGALRTACYLVPVTAAYELAGRLRATWTGFTGGREAERELAAFFGELERRGTP
jgi:hypothetical protein